MEEAIEVISDLYHKSYPSKRQMMLKLQQEGKWNDTVKDAVNEYYDKWIEDVYKVPKRRTRRYSKFSETIIDRQHQMDLMEMPMDSKHRWTYLLDYIDVASRKGVCVGITSKTTPTVLRALKKIYESPEDSPIHMRRPQILQTDGGNEFKGVVHQYLIEQGIDHRVTLEKNHQAIVERFNGTIAKPLVRYMDYMEAAGAERRPEYKFDRWSDVLEEVIKDYNNRYHTGIKNRPELVYQGEVTLVAMPSPPPTQEKDILENGTLLRKIIDRPNTEHVRATDPRWSREVYIVCGKSRKSESDPYKYKLMSEELEDEAGGYYRDELLVVNDSTFVGGYTMTRYAG